MSALTGSAVPATPTRGRRLRPQLSEEKTTPPPKSNDEKTTPPASRKRSSGATANVATLKNESGMRWFHAHMDLIAEADCHIATALADRKHFCEHTTPEVHQICDEVFNNVLKMGPHGAENNSVLLLGEAGSGKTHVVEWCIKELLQVEPTTVVLRAYGSAYATDVECLRHLATQMTSRLDSVPHANASFQAGMEWIKNVFKGSFKQARAMVMVLDQFEYFCSRGRQTLLYNLFDIAQEAGVHLSVIGTSEKMDVMDMLEKRIRSRFSMRHLQTFLPTTMEGLVQILMARLRIPPNSGMKTSFVNQFHKHLESALYAKRNEWKPHLECGQAPSWFLNRCLTVASLLHDHFSGEPARKSTRMATLPSCTGTEATMLLIDSLAEDDHIVLIAFYRLQSRCLTTTLSTVLHEIKLLHESAGTGNGILHSFNADFYAAAFDRLLRLKLLELARAGPGDVSERHLLCLSCVDLIYKEFVQELGNSGAAEWKNPLRNLPMPIQQWASRQRG